MCHISMMAQGSMSSTDGTNQSSSVTSEDYVLMLDTETKIYGLRANWGIIKMLSMNVGIQAQFVDKGASECFMGLGFSPTYTVGPILVGGNLYPYASYGNYYEYQGMNKYGKEVYDQKSKVSYGAGLDLKAGVKLYTTGSGKSVYLTGSYHVAAPEFKTDGMFKAGLWGIGLSFVGL